MNNPIVQRELVGLLRTRRALIFQVGLVAALAVLVLFRWPTGTDDGGGVVVDLTGVQSQQVMRVFGYGLMIAVMLLSPAFPATSIVREKLSGTFVLLISSPMSRWSIYSGKLVGVIGYVLLLLVLSLPATAACFAMGGPELTGQLLKMYLLLFVMAVQYATLGLWVSSHATSMESALRLTYGAMLMMVVVVLGPYMFTQGMAGATVTDWLRCVSPVPAMMQLLGHAGVGTYGIASRSDPFGRYVAIACGSIVLFALLTIRRLDMSIFDKARATGVMTDDRSASGRALRRIMFIFDPKRRSGLIGPWSNAVMVKEFRTRRFGRASWLVRLILGSLIASLALTLATLSKTIDWGPAQVGAVLVILQMALIILITPSLASGLICGELESGGWQLLQLTPLSSVSIITGKLLSVIWTLLLILLATMPAYAVMILIDETQVTRIVRVLVCMGLTAVFALLFSSAVSSMFRRTASATAVAYALLIGLCAGTMVVWLGRGAPFSNDVVAEVLKFNPLAAALAQLGHPSFQYDLVPINWWIMAIGSIVCLLVLLWRTWRLTRPQ